MFGGFGLCGSPLSLIDALQVQGAKQLYCISSHCGLNGHGLIKLVESK